MNGHSETVSGQGPEQDNMSSAPGRDETVPLLPRNRDEKAQGVLGCLMAKETWAVAMLIVGIAVFSFFYFERRPQRLESANLERIIVDVGASAPRAAEISAQALTDRPRNDERRYEVATLPNGLEVLSIQDANSLKSAFAMAVKAGSFDDPEMLPGLAHFCEHMLFLGTKQFPEPSGFDNFMARSGGQDNAYTASEVTVYYGELSQPAAPEGLQRFADFFREPLFDKRFVRKEVHAIDSEHAKNVQNPSYRVIQVMNSLSDTSSPVGRFHTGNMETLYDLPKQDGRDPVDALEVYFQDHYCPKQMRLVTFGASPPHEQLSSAAKLFGPIPPGNAQCNAERKGFAKPAPWPADKLGRWVSVEGTEPRPQLWVHFPLPDLTKEFRGQPLQYLDYVLSYDGEDSLGRVLQDTLGLVSASQVMFDMASAGTSLYFVTTLTPLGRKHPETVLDVFFAYVAVLRGQGVDEALYGTIADVMKLKWDWAEPSGPSSTASDLAERMTRLPLDHLLSGDSRIDKPNPKLVDSLIRRLTPDNMNIAFVEPNYTQHPVPNAQIKTLPYYGVKYSVDTVSTILPGAARRWSSWQGSQATPDYLHKGLAARLATAGVLRDGTPAPFPKVPSPIDDVPKDINLDHMAVKSSSNEPAGIDEELFGPRPSQMSLKTAFLDSSNSQSALRGQRESTSVSSDPTAPEVWYRSGWVTNSPKVTIQLDMRPLLAPDEGDVPALDAVRLGMYSRILGAEIAPKMADLTATGVSYDISVSAHGLSFAFGGFAPMLPRLVDTVLAEFNRFNQNSSITMPSRFKRIKEELKEELSTYTDMPVTYAVEERTLLLSKSRHSSQESVQALSGVTLESAATSANELLLARPLQLTALAMGNLEEDEARAAISKVWNGLQRHLSSASIKAATSGEVERVAPVVNPGKPVEVRSKNPRPDDPNDVVVVSFLAGVGTVEKRVVMGLLGQILQNVAYNELRTSRQLGYVVSAGSSMLSNVQYISTVVQGNVLKADEVESAIEIVLTDLMPKRLQNLSQSEFASYVDSFQQELLQPPLAPSEEVNQFWGPVRQGGHCFELRSEILKYLNSSSLTRQHLKETWQELVLPSEGVRKKVVVKYFAGTVPPPAGKDEAHDAWLKQGLSEAAAQRLQREREQGIVLDRADSEARAKLLQDSGYFPRDLNCRYDAAGKTSGEAKAVATMRTA